MRIPGVRHFVEKVIVEEEFDFTYRTDAWDVGRNELPEGEEIKPLISSLRHTRHSKRSLLDWNLPRCVDALKGPKAIIPRQDFRASQSIGQSASDFDSLDPPRMGGVNALIASNNWAA